MHGKDIEISEEEFKIAYLEVLKQPNAFDSPALRRQFLDEMIQRRLLANEARTLGFAEGEDYKYRQQAFTNKYVRLAHYNQVIAPGISINDAELRETFAFMQESRSIKHLFSKDSVYIYELYDALEIGTDFDVLARLIYDDPSLAESGGSLGWVNWDQLDYTLAEAAWRQDVQIYSKPIQSSYGWHILHVQDYRKNPLLSEEEFEKKLSHTKTILKTRKGETLALAYIQDLMGQQKIITYPEVAQQVATHLSKSLVRTPTAMDASLPTQISEKELNQLSETLWDIRNETMAETNQTQISVADFLYHLQYIPYYATYRSFKESLDFVLRDVAIMEDATSKGISAQQDGIALRSSLFSDYQLQLSYRHTLRQDAGTDSVARSNMNVKVESLKMQAGLNIDYEAIDKIIENILAKV